MKKVLTLSSLLLVGICAAAKLAETTGLALPAVINAQNLLIAFVVGFTSLIVISDYAPRKWLKLPAGTTTTARAAAPVRRAGYSIRRGADAARLAPPPASVTIFPKSSTACCDRAA